MIFCFNSLALFFLEQVVPSSLFLEQKSKIVHLTVQFLYASLPLSNDLTLFLDLFVSVRELINELRR